MLLTSLGPATGGRVGDLLVILDLLLFQGDKWRITPDKHRSVTSDPADS